MEGIAIKKHSELGIVSVSIIVFEIMLWVFLFAFVGKLESYSIFDYLLYLSMGLPIVALIFGIWGLTQKERRKIFPIIGIVLSILELSFIIYLWHWY
jgi:hypothetical protein